MSGAAPATARYAVCSSALVASPAAVADLRGAVVDCILREDLGGWRTRGIVEERAEGSWLVVPSGAGLVELAVDVGGLWDLEGRPAAVRVGGREVEGPEDLLDVLADDLDPEDGVGLTAWALEVSETLAAAEFAERTRSAMHERLTQRHGPISRWAGMTGAVAFDALAAHEPHPVYPTWRSRGGLSPDGLERFAPESAQPFLLRWCAVPAAEVRGRLAHPAHRPTWWPTADEVGLDGLDESWALLPVHPLGEHTLVPQALRARGIEGLPAPLGAVQVMPTLSLRTLALTAHPRDHVKVPLPLATLGARNRRTIAPGTLIDGETAQALLTAVQRREPEIAERVLLADESCWGHAGHEGVGALVRRYPALDEAVVVPLAALSGQLGGVPVAVSLANRFFDGDVWALFASAARLQLETALLLLTYGIALEAHQQNVALVLDTDRGSTRIRLLLKDNDGLRVHRDHVARLGSDARLVSRFADERIVVSRFEECLDVFTTITVNLCVVAVARRLGTWDGSPDERWRAACADALEEALHSLRDAQVQALVRERVLDAERWPVKAMVTAGTLRSQARTAGRDINKYYTTGPNPLRRKDFRDSSTRGEVAR